MQMKEKLFFLLVSLLFLFISCTNNKADAQYLCGSIRSFSIGYEGETIVGEVDEENMTISLPGVRYTSAIKSVSYELSADWKVVVEPNTWLGTWKKEEVLSLVNGNGEKRNYKVLLPDFIRPNIDPYLVGYIPANYGTYPDVLSKIKWNYLTHINIAFVYVKSSGELDDRIVRDRITELRNLAHKNGVKVLFSLRSDEKEEFYNAIKNEYSRKILVENVIKYAEENGLDGVDIDYETYDKVCPELIAFVRDLYYKKGRKLLQTCAVASWNPVTLGGYTSKWHNYFDIINIMTYDFTGTWSKEGQHSSFEQTVKGIEMWTNELDAPAYKLTMGLPFYGYSWDDEVFKATPVAVSYDQILNAYPNEKVWEKDQVGRTYYNGCLTIEKKCLKAKEMNLGGMMIWQILHDTDNEKYSLMNVVGTTMDSRK